MQLALRGLNWDVVVISDDEIALSESRHGVLMAIRWAILIGKSNYFVYIQAVFLYCSGCVSHMSLQCLYNIAYKAMRASILSYKWFALSLISILLTHPYHRETKCWCFTWPTTNLGISITAPLSTALLTCWKSTTALPVGDTPSYASESNEITEVLNILSNVTSLLKSNWESKISVCMSWENYNPVNWIRYDTENQQRLILILNSYLWPSSLINL